jgi:aspartyl-tRNA(Asn)/glutamyl-tRNA(Gln) amidotransferase subunit A
VSAYGALPLAQSLDAVGPMARRMRDVSLLLRLLAGHDPRDRRSLDEPVPDYPDAPAELAGVRIGVPTSFFWDGVDEQIASGCRNGLRRLADHGAVLVEVEPPPGTAEILAVPGTYGHTAGPEALRHHARWLIEREELYGDDIRSRFAVARQVTSEQHARAQTDRVRWAAGWREVFADAGLDAIAHPTIPQPPAVLAADGSGPGPCIALAKAWPLCGFPALSVPVGLDRRGLPVGLQLAALPEHEAALVGLGIALDEDVQLFRHQPVFG